MEAEGGSPHVRPADALGDPGRRRPGQRGAAERERQRHLGTGHRQLPG